jgi:hypothetical protein
MSFGYSVGDFVAIGTLAWKVYKSCRQAPESFGEIAFEVASLQAVLKEAEETVFVQPLPAVKQQRLKAVGDGCFRVLQDLAKLVTKYESLGTPAKRTWDRMGWGNEDIAALRARLTSNVAAWIRYERLSLDFMLMQNPLACLKLMSRKNSKATCRSVGKESEKGP